VYTECIYILINYRMIGGWLFVLDGCFEGIVHCSAVCVFFCFLRYFLVFRMFVHFFTLLRVPKGGKSKSR
jgi:hypothetical protein